MRGSRDMRWTKASFLHSSASHSPQSLRLGALGGAFLGGLSLSFLLKLLTKAEAETKRGEGGVGGGEVEKLIKRGSKRRVVVLGSGWGAVSLLKGMSGRLDVDVVCISPTNYFLMTPLLPSATVGQFCCLIIPHIHTPTHTLTHMRLPTYADAHTRRDGGHTQPHESHSQFVCKEKRPLL